MAEVQCIGVRPYVGHDSTFLPSSSAKWKDICFPSCPSRLEELRQQCVLRTEGDPFFLHAISVDRSRRDFIVAWFSSLFFFLSSLEQKSQEVCTVDRTTTPNNYNNVTWLSDGVQQTIPALLYSTCATEQTHTLYTARTYIHTLPNLAW